MAFVARIAEQFIEEIKKPTNQQKLRQRLLTPLVEHIMTQIYPYIMTIMIVQAVLILMVGILVYYLFKLRLRTM